MDLIKKTKDILEVHCFFMIGIPGENYDEMQDTFDFIKNSAPDSMSMSIAVPLPGTELLEICERNNYLIDGFSFDLNFERVGSINTDDFSGSDLEMLLNKKNKELNEYLVSKNPRAKYKYDEFSDRHAEIDKKTLFNKV